jgi:hypothetical protein
MSVSCWLDNGWKSAAAKASLDAIARRLAGSAEELIWQPREIPPWAPDRTTLSRMMQGTVRVV